MFKGLSFFVRFYLVWLVFFDSSKVTFDNVGKMPLHIDKKNTPDKTKEDIKFGKAYLQAAYHQFIKL